MFWKDLLPLSKKRVNYRLLFDWKHWKNTVKHNVLEGFLIYIYIYVGVGYRHWNMEKLKKTLSIAVFSTVGEIRELEALSNMMFSTGFMATKV